MRYLLYSLAFLLAFCSAKNESQLDKLEEAKTYVKANSMDSSIVILIDMKIHSGKKRFNVYDIQNDSLLISGLVSHGCCGKEWAEDESKENPVFSNVPNSHCSSLGKYKIGERGYSNWGINVNYRLHGLEITNSKSNSRDIVLHSWELVSDDEVYPQGTPEGWGCPALSNNVMRKVDALLKGRNNVLLWIYK